MSQTPNNSFPLIGRISPTSNDRARIQRLTEEAEDGKRPIGDARREMYTTAGFCGLALPEQFLYRWEGKDLVFWEHPGETPTNPACWCRNCDKAAKASLSPLAAIHLGSRFIVCPDCGNKRCPRGTNHELACTNSNEAGQPGSEWENVKPASIVTLPNGTCSVDTGVGRTVFAAPAAELLSAARLTRIAEIPSELMSAHINLVCVSPYPRLNSNLAFASLAAQCAIEELLAHYAAAEARAAEADAQVAMLRVELEVEQDGLHWLTQKHAKILTGVVNALRGTPPPLTLWSHHDAAELAVAMVARVAEQERELSYERQMRQQTEEAMIKLATQC